MDYKKEKETLQKMMSDGKIEPKEFENKMGDRNIEKCKKDLLDLLKGVIDCDIANYTESCEECGFCEKDKKVCN